MELYLRIVNELRGPCSDAGFDLIQPLAVGAYNDSVDGPLRLEDFGVSAHLVVVIGNTRALWPRFCDALRRDQALAAMEHPLEAYTERCISRAVEAIGVPASLRWSHDVGERLVAMQRLAHAAGLAYLSESHLSVHPKYGPWIALRAAVSFRARGPACPAPALRHPCGGCAHRCLPAFERALAEVHGRLTEHGARQNWRSWLACRDACPTGREHRYSEGQIRYHYLNDSEQLRRECLDRENGSERYS
jgi:cyanocobalamin reductase (cyanide-eliminating) / alkylcobalamin dealkylase